MRRDESGYVTVEHAVGFVAVTLMIGVIVAVAQAGITGSSCVRRFVKEPEQHLSVRRIRRRQRGRRTRREPTL